MHQNIRGRPRYQRGQSLIEVIVSLGIVALFTALFAISAQQHPGALGTSTLIAKSEIDEGYQIAQSSGNGATVVFTPKSGSNGYAVDLYVGRPNGQYMATTATDHQTSILAFSSNVTGIAPLAVFIDSDGNATATSWTPTGGNFIPAPTCPPDGIILTLTNNSQTQSLTIACNDAQMG